MDDVIPIEEAEAKALRIASLAAPQRAWPAALAAGSLR